MSQKHDETTANLLIDEIEEDLRHERYANIWKKYAAFFSAAAVIIVVAVVGWQIWRAWTHEQRRHSSVRYEAAMTLLGQGKTHEAATELAELAKNGSSGYRLLARFQQAEMKVHAGDLKDASALYHAIAADGGVDRIYRGMALIKAGYLDLSIKPPAIVAKEVAPLTAKGDPWRYSAREITALAALKEGDRAKAVSLFTALSSAAGAPQGLRARAAQMVDIEKAKTAG